MNHEQWRHWIRETYTPEPAPQVNPVWTMYQLLPSWAKALCQKPIPIVQNREPIIDQPIDEPDLENYKFSNEVPANLSFEAQGSEFTNEWIDASQEPILDQLFVRVSLKTLIHGLILEVPSELIPFPGR